MVINKDVLPLPTGPVIPTSCPLVACSETFCNAKRCDESFQKLETSSRTTCGWKSSDVSSGLGALLWTDFAGLKVSKLKNCELFFPSLSYLPKGLGANADFLEINLCILLHAVLASARRCKPSPILTVTKNLMLVKTESNVNTWNVDKECPVRSSAKIEMNPVTVWLVKNRAWILDRRNPRIRMREISFLHNIFCT